MAPVETVATILSTFAYGETSKIARLATRELGVVSAIAKGARRPKSKFGVALQSLCGGQATLYLARHSDLHTLASFDVTTVPEDLARNIDRYASASVLGELMIRFSPHERNVGLYDFFAHSLAVLVAVPDDAVPILGLRSIWGLVKQLGFAPTLNECARDGVPVAWDQASVAFSPPHGGVLCPSCARGVESSQLTARDLADLEVMIHGRGDLPALDDRYLAAHRRLLERYVRYHLAEGGDLPGFAFWLAQDWKSRR